MPINEPKACRTLISNIYIPKPSNVDLGELDDHVPRLDGPKRQHFIPEMYLKGFAKSGLVSLYDRIKKEYRHQSPKNTTVQGHYYTYDDTEGRRRYDIEYMFGTYESAAAPVIQKLTLRQQISNEEICDIANFISIMAFRTPDIIDSTKDLHENFVKRLIKTSYQTLESTIATLRRHSDRKGMSDSELEDEARELRSFALSDEYKVETDHQWAVSASLHMLSNIPSVLMQRNWTVLHSPNPRRSFVTSDSPVVLTTMLPRPPNPYGIGYANADAVVFFPLTLSCGVMIWGEGDQMLHSDIDEEDLRHFNRMVADRCQRFLIGRDEALIRSLVDFLGLDKKVWKQKFSVQ